MFSSSQEKLMGVGKGLAGSHQLSPAKCQCWLDFSRGQWDKERREKQTKKKEKTLNVLYNIDKYISHVISLK